jgi:hypothetical protein
MRRLFAAVLATAFVFTLTACHSSCGSCNQPNSCNTCNQPNQCNKCNQPNKCNSCAQPAPCGCGK